MSTLALIRPNDWDWVLLLHVGGAMILVGGMLTASSTLLFARGDARLLRLGYFSLLAVGVPGYVLMRIGAEWLYSKEGFNELPEEAGHPAWIDIGYLTADLGALLLLIALIGGSIGTYRLRNGKGAGLLNATMIISLVLLAAFVVTIWAMAGKPD
jgi:hypothetical protein